MAKLVDKDPFVYEQEKTGFLQTLHQFLASKGSPFSRSPVIDAKELDLYLLYLKVTELGGFQKVTDGGQWTDLLNFFRLPGNCSHAANTLRQIYVRHLELYEKIHFLGEDEDDKDRSGTRSTSTPVRSIASVNKGGYQASSAGLCMDFPPNVSEYDKLQFSLLSGLPNEVDFAINVCTLLSNEGRHVLHLAKAPQLIDHLLAHTGVFFEGPGSMRPLYEECWKTNVSRDFIQFWYDTVNDDEVREIIGPVPFKPADKRQFKDPQLFCQRKLGLQDVEGQRILQIAIILKNLSFEDANRSIMAAHRTLYRFLLLCIHNSCSMLRQVGTDTLSNLAPEFVLDSIAYRSTQLMFHTIYKGLEDDDRFIVLRSLEVVEKLLEVVNNIEVLEQCLEHRVYDTVINLLHIHDIQILLGALELLLVMSEKGSKFCTFICRVNRSIDILVCLVTLDAQSLGADAFVGIKIIDPNPPEGPHQQQQQQPHQVPGVSRAGPQHAPTPPPQQQQMTPGMKSPARGGTSTTVTPGAATPPTTPMSAKDAEAERFACQWLNCHVESNKELSVARVELYAEYLADCKQAKGNVLSSTNFARCVRFTYPHVGMKKVVGPVVQYHLSGIGRRKQPLPFTWQPQEALTNAVLSSSARPASSMIAHLASKHSPSPSPPPPRSGPYPPPPGGTPNQQRGHPPPPPPPHHQQGRPMPGFHQNYPHGSPQVMNVRTGYPPGAATPGSLSAYQPSPHYPQQHSSQQYRPPMAPSRLVYGPNPGGIVAPTSGSNVMNSGTQPHLHQPHQPPLQQPHQLPQPQFQGGPQPAHSGPQQAHSGPQQAHIGHQQPYSGPQPPHSGPQPFHSGPQYYQTQDGTQIGPSRQQIQAGPPLNPPGAQVSSGGPQMSSDGPQVQLTRPPTQQGLHVQLSGPPIQNTNQTSTGPNGQQQQQAGQQNVPPRPPNGLVVLQGTNGNIVLQRAPEVGDQGTNPAAPPVCLPTPPNTSITPTANTKAQEQPPPVEDRIPPSDPGQLPIDNPLDPPQPPIPPPCNPMVDALSPTGRSTPCPSEVSVKSQTDSELISNATDGDGSDQHPATRPSAADLMDGEVRIQKVPNALLDEDEGKKAEIHPPASKQSEGVPESVPSSSAPPSTKDTASNDPPSNDPPSDVPLSSAPENTPASTAPSANIPPTNVPSSNAPSSTAPTILPKTTGVAASAVPVIEPQFTTAGNKIIVTVPTRASVNAAIQPVSTKSIALVHTANPIVPGTTNPVVHQVVPASGQIRNVLVPSQSIVLNVQPMVQGQVQISTPTSLQPRPVTPRQQPVNIQPKPIQPKPASFSQPAATTGTQVSAAQSSNGSVPQTKTISIQPSTTVLRPGPPMMALQAPGVPQQIVLGQGFVVRQPNQVQGTQARPQFVANIQTRLPFQQGQAMVVTSSSSQLNPSSLPQAQGPNSAPLVSFGCNTVTSQNNDAPLIKRLLQQNSPLSPNRSQPPPPQMQFVQSQGQLVAVNTTWPPPPTYQPQRQGPVNIAPRPVSQQQQGGLSLSVGFQGSHCGPVQYIPGGLGPRPADQISLPGELSSPTSSTSSSSRSKKKKSKDKHKKSKKKSKKHSKQRSHSPAGSRDSESVVSETISEANPSENSQDSMDHPIVVPQTPDINNPLRTQFSGALPPDGITCNGGSLDNVTPKKPAPRRAKSRSPRPSKMTPPVTPNKIVNGVGEEVMIPVEAIIERIENPHHIDNQRGRATERQPAGGDNPSTRGLDGREPPINSLPEERTKFNEQNDSSKEIAGKDVVIKSPNSIGKGIGEDRIISRDFELSEKNTNNSNDMKESVVKHFINGDMTDNFLQNQLTAALEDKLEREIVKSIRRSIEKDHKTVTAIVQSEEISQEHNKKKLLSNCDSFVNSILPKDQKFVKSDNTNGPIRALENGDVTANDKVLIGRDAVDESNENVHRSNKSSITTAINGHPDGCPYVLSPNTSVSSSPIGSPPPPPSDQSRTGVPVVTSSQVQPSHHSYPPSGNQDQRGVKRTAEEMARCDTPSSMGSGPLSPPAVSEAPPKKGSSKKRRSSSTSSSGKRERKSSGKGKGHHHHQQQQQANPMSNFYICEWNGCHKNLTSTKALHVHAYREHVMSEAYKGVCEWEGCDNIKRQRWSTVTHLQEKHCTEESLLTAAERRTQPSGASKDPAPPSNPVVYHAHTAYHAIKRSLHPPSLSDLVGEKEGPVTRSIRITSSLILKNIAKYSGDGRRLILRYEDTLSRVALSKAESASTIAKCLWFAHQDEDR